DEFVFDDPREVRDWLIAAQKNAIDKNRRSAGYPGFQPVLIVRLHLAPKFSAGQAGRKKLLVEAEPARTLNEAWLLKHRLIGEKQVMIFPEPGLLGCATGSLRCKLRLRVNLGQREVAVTKAHAAFIFGQQLLQCRLHALAIGTLKIGELHNRDGHL